MLQCSKTSVAARPGEAFTAPGFRSLLGSWTLVQPTLNLVLLFEYCCTQSSWMEDNQ